MSEIEALLTLARDLTVTGLLFLMYWTEHAERTRANDYIRQQHEKFVDDCREQSNLKR